MSHKFVEGGSVGQVDKRFSPLHGAFASILVGNGELFLCAEEAFAGRNEVEVHVVEDEVFGVGVPLVDVEAVVEVHMLSQRAGPRSFTPTGRSDENEGTRSV